MEEIEIYDKKTNYGLDNFEEKYDLLGIIAGLIQKNATDIKSEITKKEKIDLSLHLFLFASTFHKCIIYNYNQTSGAATLMDERIRQEKIKEYLDEAIRYACKYCVIIYHEASPQNRENDAHYYAAYAAAWGVFHEISNKKVNLINKETPFDNFVREFLNT